MSINARMRRLMSDYEQLKKTFARHKYISITPVGSNPPEKYHVTYFVNGLYKTPDGRIETLGRHEVDIILHSDYPRYKPICKIQTPIWHPNFRDDQICIGDIWGAGESLSDIIINIGDMIQYKSWNSYSPLSAEAAQWAIENSSRFPVGNVELNVAEGISDGGNTTGNINNMQGNRAENVQANLNSSPFAVVKSDNDFDITSDELMGIEFIPSTKRSQAIRPGEHGSLANKSKINFVTVLKKGLIWALIGAFVGFVCSEIFSHIANNIIYSNFRLYNDIASVVRIEVGIWSSIIALFIGLSLGIGEGVYYGSNEKAIRYGGIGAGISIITGYISGWFAQLIYSVMLDGYLSSPSLALARGIGWAIMGLGIGIAIGLIKPDGKRMLSCTIGGTLGAFIGGTMFDGICNIIPNDIFARIVAILLMGALIGVSVGILEQFAKQAWLKVVRGEFEGKEYLVFSGITSIGNDGRNTIVLFKDRMIAQHHCDICLEGKDYIIRDMGSPGGTVVNGVRVQSQILRNGDTISIGNSVLVFNTK